MTVLSNATSQKRLEFIFIGILSLFSLMFISLIPTPVFADAQAFKECAINALMEILAIALITEIISIVVEHGIGALAKRAGSKLLKKLAIALGKKLVPWIGAALIVAELIWLLKDCIELLFK